MTTSTQWQLARASAERYQRILTPMILGPFARALVDFAALRQRERVLDVGCGTGAAARYAAEAVGNWGEVVGIDVNASMLEVARSLPAVPGAPIAWHEASATHLPLNDNSVDVVLCAQVLQFLPQKQLGLAEMRRVLRGNGRIALSLWCNIDENPYFAALVAAIERHIGSETASGLRAAFALTATDKISASLMEAGVRQVENAITQLDLPFADLTGFVPRHISATPMAAGFQHAPEAKRRAVIQEVTAELKHYQRNGRTHIPFRSHMILGKI